MVAWTADFSVVVSLLPFCELEGMLIGISWPVGIRTINWVTKLCGTDITWPTETGIFWESSSLGLENRKTEQ